MTRGICSLSIVPLRKEASDRSEMINQVLFGETYLVVEQRKKWLRIRLDHDGYEGWIDRKQFHHHSEASNNQALEAPRHCCGDLIEIVAQEGQGDFFPIFLGSFLPHFKEKSQLLQIADQKYHYGGLVKKGRADRAAMIEIAQQYRNAPYLWGGRTPAGIDCSGFTQMVYRLAGYALPRDSQEQAKLGQALSFIEESEPGDLAFFDNEEGVITHVGLVLENNYILHASGKVRLDRLDQTGIFNPQERTHTHKLRVIKKII